MTSIKDGCARRKNNNPAVHAPDATISKKTIELASGIGVASIALRNKPRSGVIGFQKKSFSNRPATG